MQKILYFLKLTLVAVVVGAFISLYQYLTSISMTTCGLLS